jgi:hypothetical protein
VPIAEPHRIPPFAQTAKAGSTHCLVGDKKEDQSANYAVSTSKITLILRA